jgi:hypothetical protein
MKSSIDLAIAPKGRKKPRRRVYLSGVITYGDGAHSFRCTVRNLTEMGAGLSFTDAYLKKIWNGSAERGWAPEQSL